MRLVLVPKARTVPPELLMESLFRSSDLEVRLSLNMNVLDRSGVPRVMGLFELLWSFLDHRMEVLVRRSRFRLTKIADRLEVVQGYLKAFLDIDRVIKIIREEDEPRPALMTAFDLTERQVEAILNLRLRNLRRLEEMELKKEERALGKEQRELQALLADEKRRRARLREEMVAGLAAFGSGPLGDRRTTLEAAPTVEPQLLELPAERFPVTVLLSAKGWIRAVRGHLEDTTEIKYKEGDAERFVLKAQSTDKLLAFSSDGRCYCLPVDRLPGGRGQGEPLSLAVDVAKGADIFAVRLHDPLGRLVLATREGRGFIASEKEIAAQTRAGKQVVNLGEGDALQVVTPVRGDLVAVVGANRKLLVFETAELPEMSRGRGVILQRYKGGGLADLKTFPAEEGLTWTDGDRTRRIDDLTGYKGKRASAGRLAPRGFPRSNRFG